MSRDNRWFQAALDGDIDTIRRMLDDGIDPDVRTDQDRTALMIAAQRGDLAMIEVLVAADVDVDACVDEEAIGGPLVVGPDMDQVESIVADAADGMSENDPEGRAFADGFVALMGALQSAVPALHETDAGGRFEEPEIDDEFEAYQLATALHHAIAYGHNAIARRLIAVGADIEAPAWDLTPPLALAAYVGNDVMVERLLRLDAQIDDGFDLTPLEAACEKGHTGIARQLVAAGAKVNWQGEDGVTPLMRAASEGNLELVRFLVESGADPCAWEQGETPLLSAVLGGHDDVAAYLEPLVFDEIRDFVREATRD